MTGGLLVVVGGDVVVVGGVVVVVGGVVFDVFEVFDGAGVEPSGADPVSIPQPHATTPASTTRV
jgi:hypothetical protein